MRSSISYRWLGHQFPGQLQFLEKYFFSQHEQVMAAILSFSGVHSFFFLLFTGFICFFTANGMLGRGFGDHIDWKTYSEGLKEAQSSRKPVMMIIHKSWCGACKALKPKFAESKEIDELSKKFVMINVEDDEEPQDTKFQIDGSYIPRIFILDSYGNVQRDIYNKKGNPSYKYYYGSPPGIVDSMKEALEKMIDGVRIGDEL